MIEVHKVDVRSIMRHRYRNFKTDTTHRNPAGTGRPLFARPHSTIDGALTVAKTLTADLLTQIVTMSSTRRDFTDFDALTDTTNASLPASAANDADARSVLIANSALIHGSGTSPESGSLVAPGAAVGTDTDSILLESDRNGTEATTDRSPASAHFARTARDYINRGRDEGRLPDGFGVATIVMLERQLCSLQAWKH